MKGCFEMKKLFLLLVFVIMLTACSNNAVETTVTCTPSPTESITVEKDEVMPQNIFVADGLNLVKSTDCSLLTDSSMDTVNLYTSSSKENGKFLWDDHARWILEVFAETGEHYILYDLEVSNGSIYFDVLEIDEKPYIFLRNISTASDYTKVFSFEDGKAFETNEIDLNDLTDKVINLIYTSVPNYR